MRRAGHIMTKKMIAGRPRATRAQTKEMAVRHGGVLKEGEEKLLLIMEDELPLQGEKGNSLEPIHEALDPPNVVMRPLELPAFQERNPIKGSGRAGSCRPPP